MKGFNAVLMLAVLCVGAESARDKTITKVVKLLQDMLDKSKSTMEKERVLYAKFKCFCDLEQAAKKAEIAELKEKIPVVESKIAKLIAATNELAIEVAQLNADISQGEAEVEAAEKTRKKGRDTFESEEKDLETAIAQMDKAIEILKALVGPKHGGAFMASKTDVEQRAVMVEEAGSFHVVGATEARQALASVSVFLTAKQQQLVHEKAEAFLQGVSSGALVSKEGKHGEWEVIKMLEMLLVQFKKNMEEMQKTEGTAVETFNTYMETQKKLLDEMTTALDEKNEAVANNEDELASKRGQLSDMQKALAHAEETLANLIESCADKAVEYEKRRRERANEEAAISEAISILNSDSAFESFGKVDATSTGKTGLLQIGSSRHSHEHEHEGSTSADAAAQGRARASAVLKATVTKSRSLRLARVAALLEEGGPFKVVLYKIGELLAVIEKEGANDAENLDWCNSERESYDKDIKKKKDEISTLKDEIEEITNTIHDPKTGLLVQIDEAEASLSKNHETQKEETDERAKEHAEYLVDMANCADAEALLKSAVKVLTNYYKKGSLVQTGRMWVRRTLFREDPPETWEEGSSTKQSDAGNEVIDMLEFIIKETKKEADDFQKAEDESKKDFDKSMDSLKEEQAELEKSIAELTETLAEKKVELMEKGKELKSAKAAKEKMENYLEKIKPGCDFITENFDAREANRKTEKAALKEAEEIIKGLADK